MAQQAPTRVKLTATRSFSYATRALKAGDVFEASRAHADILVALKKAKANEHRELTPLPPPEPELAERMQAAAQQVSPLDHDRDGRPGGSTAPPPADDLAGLREEYTRVTGKRVFSGWSADQLREKLAAHQAGNA